MTLLIRLLTLSYMRENGGMPWTCTALLFPGAHCLANRPGPLGPVDIPNWSAWGDLHSQGCSILSRTGLLFPINHTPVGDPGLAPGRLGDFKSPGSAVPAEASRREMVGMKGIAPTLDAF